MRPLAGSTRRCCRLPWHQRRSRAARSISDGGLSSKTAAERRQHVDGIAGAADQRRLDEIMAEDMAAERRLAAAGRAGRNGRRRRAVRMIALWPQ